MFDSISIGMSGLQTFSKGLKVISNNVANLNTPGFKSSNIDFAALYYQGGEGGGFSTDVNSGQTGTGVTALTTFINFKDGDVRQTGNSLDVSIDGQGFLITKDSTDDGYTYTRAGQFEFDKDGNLVSRATGRQVMGLSADGKLDVISLTGLRISQPKASTSVKFSGNLSSSATNFTLDSLKLVDGVGGAHVVKLLFKPKTGEAGTWTVTVVDGTVETPAGELQFLAGTPVSGKDKLNFKFAPAGVPAFDIALDFSQQVTSFSTGTTSTLAVSSLDGQVAGTVTQVDFDSSGQLTLKYSNGASAVGPSLALATFESTAHLGQLGASEFSAQGLTPTKLARAGTETVGKIVSKQIEGSNVDLSAEFSDLIVMQRGYQASSRIVSTANEMLQDLFDMKGHR
ncbi:flagellar biosynthesis protein FlgF [Paucibacter sp. KBW04]|uniref:flagellar hook protein FlgE n=1 Tax=Paucibacter sp. KBW04 TaxID=2153361 RepID=UPI000F588A37|nr:flagellar hook-basal body complex protein [Paucibacter sp. KBW04]RQO63598.1 flagellar biosynthesis protein FlgF [Paucibacter sp. KBW04]